eukprot:TRINITY_DN444_c0_g1_i3.p1 TRINITY_DN444_c0_g1~~TRINITY_DN444_c0_g1_i3.p1  ORF type:complete len:124 (-),score=27.05 TRINITY_DN444_c0_g1_i3:33-404(-)
MPLQSVSTICKMRRINSSFSEVRSRNATKSRTEKLELPKTEDGTLPHLARPSLEELLVAGNEKLPSGGTNTWNRTNLLRKYGKLAPDEESDSEDSAKSRELRLRIAATLGVTREQLNFAQLTL